MELWSAIDYLINTGQSKKAVPYLDRFIKSQPDDASLVAIRDRFGIGAFLRLADDPATASYAKPLADTLAAASRRFATQPDRLAKAVSALTGTPGEQNYGVAQLKEAGPHAIPALVEALQHPGIAAKDQALLVRNMGRLEGSAVPALLAVLDSGDPRLQTGAASALGNIGDPRAIPFLTYPASAIEFTPEVREAAQSAIAQLSGKPFVAQTRTPAQVLTDTAWEYYLHQIEFPGDKVAVWGWDKDRKTVAPRTLKRGEAEEYFGQRLADEALRLQPTDLNAQTAALSLALRKTTEKTSPSDIPAGDKAAFDKAFAAGPGVMTAVLKKAIADRDDNLAAMASNILGKLTDPAQLAATGRPHPLVEVLWAPGPRAPLEAAKVIVELAPTQPFPGSSRLVPTLARYIMTQHSPRAIVIDDNPSRASQVAGAIQSLGYETVVETSGNQGFLAAAETADVELVFVSHAFSPSSWSVSDILTNLRSDSRTKNVPVYVYGPGDLEVKRPNLPTSFPGVKYLVQPVNGETLEKLLGGKPSQLSDTERGALADEAAKLLARIASQPKSPFAEDLSSAEPALAIALSQPGTIQAASTALGDVPDADAQRSLADVVLDAARPAELRRGSAAQLARSIQRFGPLVSGDQELMLVAAAKEVDDPQLRSALEKTVTALRSRVNSMRRSTRTVTPAVSPPADSPAPSGARP
jgi:CheY-like chemotaxis protein